ncbi:hypothetical protein ANCDUO_25542 [Ancylostoma duodenale]|uniref:Uncharacterized protein n=1 Tax=Ancylostoma duodenale TaxID=51022 RepID=A0A0C2C452_9BILA|nr:hypothetical protein ANCDUO_25542 [Ancylostoma duodenale]
MVAHEEYKRTIGSDGEMELPISVMEMGLVRWMGGITQLDRFYHQDIRERFGIAAIADKFREAHLR